MMVHDADNGQYAMLVHICICTIAMYVNTCGVDKF